METNILPSLQSTTTFQEYCQLIEPNVLSHLTNWLYLHSPSKASPSCGPSVFTAPFWEDATPFPEKWAVDENAD